MIDHYTQEQSVAFGCHTETVVPFPMTGEYPRNTVDCDSSYLKLENGDYNETKCKQDCEAHLARMDQYEYGGCSYYWGKCYVCYSPEMIQTYNISAFYNVYVSSASLCDSEEG
jgi:hypothetical protein